MNYTHNPYHALSTNYRYGCRCPICTVNEKKRYRRRRDRAGQPNPPVRLLNGPAANRIIKVKQFSPILRVTDKDNILLYGSSTMSVLPDGTSTVGFIYLRSEPLSRRSNEH